MGCGTERAVAYVLGAVFLLGLLGGVFTLFQPPVHDVADDRCCQQAEQLERAEDGGVEGNWEGGWHVTGAAHSPGDSLSSICRLSEEPPGHSGLRDLQTF